MKKIFLLLFLVLFSLTVFAQSEEKVLILSLHSTDGNLSFENAFIQPGVFASTLNTGKISGTIYSGNNEKLFSFKFDLDDTLVIEDVGLFKEKDFSQTLVLPYYENAEKVVFFNEETNQTLIVPIAFLANLCGNGVCNISESYRNCSQDCSFGSGDNYCDRREDRICDLDCRPQWLDKDCIKEIYYKAKTPRQIQTIVNENKEKQEGSLVLFGVIAIFGFVIITIFVILVSMEKNKMQI